MQPFENKNVKYDTLFSMGKYQEATCCYSPSGITQHNISRLWMMATSSLQQILLESHCVTLLLLILNNFNNWRRVMCCSRRGLQDFHRTEMWYPTHVMEFLFFICPGSPLMWSQNRSKPLRTYEDMHYPGITLVQWQTIIGSEVKIKS